MRINAVRGSSGGLVGCKAEPERETLFIDYGVDRLRDAAALKRPRQ